MSALVTSTERLQRLLALVPYVVSRKSVGLAETAAAFGVSERELVDDLNLLWCVELRAPDPYCPIDLSYEGGEIVVSQAESMDRPLRLGVDEASALLVALRMLAEVGQVASVPSLVYCRRLAQKRHAAAARRPHPFAPGAGRYAPERARSPSPGPARVRPRRPARSPGPAGRRTSPGPRSGQAGTPGWRYAPGPSRPRTSGRAGSPRPTARARGAAGRCARPRGS